MALGRVLDGVALSVDILTAHVEDHGGATAVLNSGVASKLDQIGRAHHSSDVVALSLDLLDILHSKVEFFRLGDGELVLQAECRLGTSTIKNEMS